LQLLAKFKKNLYIGLSATLNFRKFHRAVFERVFLAGHTVALVAYSAMKMITTCLPMTGHFFDTMIVASIDNEW